MSVFDQCYNDDDTGRPAYNLTLLLKIMFPPVRGGIVSGRQIERCCRENAIFMALSADAQRASRRSRASSAARCSATCY